MLTVHKNTKDQRESKEIRKYLIADAKDLARMPDVCGYALVVWNREATADAAWSMSATTIPGQLVPEFAKQIIERKINQMDTNEIIDMRFE